MKNVILLFIISWWLIPSVKGQIIDTLPTNKEAFVTALKQKFEATNRSELKDLFKEFDAKLKQNLIADKVIDDLIESSNKMLKLRGKAYPQLQQLLKHYLALNEIPLAANQWSQFQQTLMALMDNATPGDSKSIIDFIEFTIPLFRENALWFSKGKIWKLSTNQFTLSINENGPIVTLNSGHLIGKTGGDSIKILNTSGIYDYTTHKWNGSKGKVNWERAGLPDAEVRALFGAYEVNLKSQGYFIEEVIFTYKDYFESSIIGKLEDKMVSTANAETTRFPRFSAQKENVPPQQLTPNVMYYGGFTLAGSKILGSSVGEPSELIIYKENSKQKILRVLTNSITINLPEKISSSNAEISLYFDEDSIYHPRIDLSYDISNNSIKLVKNDGNITKYSFFNSYHKLDFKVDVITWKLDENEINLSTLSSSGLKAASFESKEYFSKQKMQDLRGNVSYDPLSILRIYSETNMQNYIYAYDFAQQISPNLTVQQVKPVIFNLVQEGFITYDKKSEKIEVKPKVSHYVLANAEKKDYDDITFLSNNKVKNASINLDNKSLNLEGVKKIPISIANSTLFFPDSQKITIEKNRNMLFNGLFFSGRIDFFGTDNYFNYEEFSMDLPQIDTLIINIPDGDKLDQYGQAILRPINSTLSQLSGSLQINLPINKSGNSALAQFPIFESKSYSKVFYEDIKIGGGAYKKEDFYYEISPFIIDSLMHINQQTLKFNGQLYSGGIFPNIDQPLRLQDDLSLGFQVSTPLEGLPVYGGKGISAGELSLDNKGLTGSGLVEFQTTKFESGHIIYYPDSLLAATDRFTIEESEGLYEAPELNNTFSSVEWFPYLDSMIAYSGPTSPFNMFNNKTQLNGQIEITNKAIHGAGLIDWDDGQLTSNRFRFKSTELLADSAALKIKTIDGDKVTFNTPNVNAYVDFTENTGYFKSNTNENRTEFNYNQYVTTIDEFFWDINNKKLEFSVPEGSTGAPFTSLKSSQDSLSFIATNADYSLEESIIEASGVTEIFIADSRVIPHDGKVSIYPEARMETLTQATIEASAGSKRHIMKDVTITISGKNDFTGTGQYKYETKNIPTQYLKLTKIESILADSSKMDKKKGPKPENILHARGLITKADSFIVYPDVQFYGDVDIYSSLNDVKINGFAKVDFKNEYVASNFLQIDGNVDPDSLDLTIDGVKNPEGKLLRTGIFVNPVAAKPIYTNILNNQIGPLDVAMLEVDGILKHDAKTQLYTFGQAEKINSDGPIKGNLLKFLPSENIIKGEGSMDFSLNYGAVEEKIAGQIRTDLTGDEYSFNVSISLPIGFDEAILDKMGYYLLEDNFGRRDVYYDEELLAHWAEFLEPKSFAKMQDELSLTGTFKKPKDLKSSMIFTDVNMKYYPTERIYRSEGQFGLSFIGDKGIHKRINGYLEFGHRMGSDYMNIYLKTEYNDFVYITYTTTLMEVASSFRDIIEKINMIKPEKRKIQGDGASFYTYRGINEMKALAFIQRMKILEEGGTLPPPDPTKVKPINENSEEGVPAEPVQDVSNPANSNVPQEVLNFEKNQEKGKNKGKDKSSNEFSIPKSPLSGGSNNPGVPQEVMDFEKGKEKGKKKKEN